MTANEQSRKGISEIEGKVARVATSESGTRSEFQVPPSRVADREKLPLLLDKARARVELYLGPVSLFSMI